MKKYRGEFWLKGEEDKAFPGEVKLGKRRSELSLIVPSTGKIDEGEFLKSDPLRPVCGVTTCGKRITLTDYFQTSFPLSFAQPRRAKFCINEAFVGLPREIGRCDPEIETAVITSKPLVEWCGVTSHKLHSGQEWGVEYSPKDSKEVYRDEECAIKLVFLANRKSARYKASIVDRAQIQMTATVRPLAWSRLFMTLANVMDVVSIGCGGYCRISRAYAVSKDPTFIADYHFHSLFPGAKTPRLSRRLFDLRDLTGNAFTKWMEKAGELKHARALFFSARHHKMFTETRVILLTQAVEAYYRRVYKDRFKLITHLKELCSEYKEPLSVVFPDWESRVHEAVKFRGQQTHYPLKMPTNSMTGEEQFAMERFLCLMLEICFMSQLDMTAARIRQLMERSNYYKQLREIYAP